MVTCTPKTVNTHRLLVKGEKVFESITVDEKDEIANEMNGEELLNEEVKQKSDLELFIEFAKKNSHLFMIIFILIILIIILNILSYIREKLNKKRKAKKEGKK